MDDIDEGKETGVIQSVQLAFQIMETLAESSQPVGVVELGRRVGVGKSRISRHLQTLCALGYTTQDLQSEKYLVGGAWNNLSLKAARNPSMFSVADLDLDALAEKTAATAVIVGFESGGCRVVSSKGARGRVSIAIPDGYLMAVHATAFGKIGLAFGSPEWIDRVKGRELARFTDRTVSSEEELSASIHAIHQQGWAATFGELTSGGSGLAAPIFWRDYAVGAVGIVGYPDFSASGPAPELVDAVVAAGTFISRKISNSFADREKPATAPGRNLR